MREIDAMSFAGTAWSGIRYETTNIEIPGGKRIVIRRGYVDHIVVKNGVRRIDQTIEAYENIEMMVGFSAADRDEFAALWGMKNTEGFKNQFEQFVAKHHPPAKTSETAMAATFRTHSKERVMTEMTKRLFVVPKADVDRMFKLLYEVMAPNSPLAMRLRGVAYANTFLTKRKTIREE